MNMKAEMGDASTSQKVPISHQKLENRHATNIPPQPSKGANPAIILVLDFQPPERKQQISVVLSHPACGILLKQP